MDIPGNNRDSRYIMWVFGSIVGSDYCDNCCGHGTRNTCFGHFFPSYCCTADEEILLPCRQRTASVASLDYNNINIIIMLPCQRQQSVASEVTSNIYSVFADLTSGRKSTCINSYYFEV